MAKSKEGIRPLTRLIAHVVLVEDRGARAQRLERVPWQSVLLNQVAKAAGKILSTFLKSKLLRVLERSRSP